MMKMLESQVAVVTRAGREAIQAAAADAGREIDPEHFGISLSYAHHEIPPAQVTRIKQRRPNLDPATVIPVGMGGLREAAVGEEHGASDDGTGNLIGR